MRAPLSVRIRHPPSGVRGGVISAHPVHVAVNERRRAYRMTSASAVTSTAATRAGNPETATKDPPPTSTHPSAEPCPMAWAPHAPAPRPAAAASHVVPEVAGAD